MAGTQKGRPVYSQMFTIGAATRFGWIRFCKQLWAELAVTFIVPVVLYFMQPIWLPKSSGGRMTAAELVVVVFITAAVLLLGHVIWQQVWTPRKLREFKKRVRAKLLELAMYGHFQPFTVDGVTDDDILAWYADCDMFLEEYYPSWRDRFKKAMESTYPTEAMDRAATVLKELHALDLNPRAKRLFWIERQRDKRRWEDQLFN